MTKIKSIFSAIYNNMWRTPKGRLTTRLKGACESIPQKQRLTVVSGVVTLFVLTGFVIFGHAGYRLGRGQAQKTVAIEHIMPIDIVTKSPVHEPQNLPDYDDAGVESED